MRKRVDSRRLRTGTQRPNRRRAMAKRQLELIPRDEKKERPVKKGARKTAVLKASPASRVKAVPKSAAKKKPEAVRLTAADLATRQREISVSEFFTKNRHLLGFDSPAKALLRSEEHTSELQSHVNLVCRLP